MRIRAWRFGNECLSFRVEGCGQGGVGVRGFFSCYHGLYLEAGAFATPGLP